LAEILFFIIAIIPIILINNNNNNNNNLNESELNNLFNCFKWGGEGAEGRAHGGSVNNVQIILFRIVTTKPPCIMNIS
jgi:hypothetical protein